MPMTVVALAWMLSSNVIYTPYLDVICRWDIPPLADQNGRASSRSYPALLQLAAAWLLVAAEPELLFAVRFSQ
jgi:putative membrane protein